MHLVLRVQTDEALQLTTTDHSRADPRRAEDRRTSPAGAISGDVADDVPRRGGAGGSRRGLPAHRRHAGERPTFDRSPGAGGTYDFTMKPNIAKDLREQAVVQAVRNDRSPRQRARRRRAEHLALRPDAATRSWSSCPACSDVGRAKEIIRSTALLELKLVEAGPAPTQRGAAAVVRRQGAARHGSGARQRRRGGDGDAPSTCSKKVAAATGRDLRSAKPSLDENNRPAVSFTLTSDGSRKFGKATGENIGRSLAIVLDKRVRSAPRIDGRITDQGTIYGSFTTQEVADLSLTLRLGRAARLPHLPRGARHRPDPRRRLDPRPA